MQPLNNQFIKDILTINNVFEIKFKESFDDIINSDNEHQYLINKNNIHLVIINYYSRYFRNIENESIFNDLKGNIIYPYNIKIFGAYHHTYNLYVLFSLCAQGLNNNKLKYNNDNIDSIDKLTPYFIGYRNGFLKGFNSFFNDKINNDLLFDDKDERIKKIFKFATKYDETKEQGFSVDMNNNLFFDNAYNLGVQNGYNYKAWSYIFENKDLFVDNFNELLFPIDNKDINSKINNGINYIDVLERQLNKIITTIKDDIKNNSYKYNYIVSEYETTFLDTDLLKQYLRVNKITNINFFKEIIKKSIIIIDLWNEDLKNIPESKFDEVKTYVKKDEVFYLNTSIDFHCWISYYDKIENNNTELSKINFFKNYNYKIYSLPSITHKCNEIIDVILTAYPELNIDDVSVTDTNKIDANILTKNYLKHINRIWFKVGVKFADGTIFNLLKKHDNNFTRVANGINIKNSKVYISISMNNKEDVVNSDKNIFLNDNKIIYIIEYCKDNNITIDDRFKEHLTSQQKKYLL